MDDFGISRAKSSIRARALDKLAQLAAIGPDDDFSRLSAAVSNDVSALPMSGKEFEVLASLSRSAPFITSEARAHQLVKQIGQYLLEIPTQAFVNSPAVRSAPLSPWQLLTDLLTRAILHLGVSFHNLKAESHKIIRGYLDKLQQTWSAGAELTQDLSKFFPFIFSIQGFLQAASELVIDLKEDDEFLNYIVNTVRTILSDDLLLAMETALSTLRSERHMHNGLWLLCLQKYAEGGSQIGAMLLSYHVCAFYKAVARSFIDTLSGKETISQGKTRNLIDMLNHAVPPQTLDATRADTLNVLKSFAVSQVESLEDGADYIELASPEKIELALRVKSTVLEIIAVAVYHQTLELPQVAKVIENTMGHDNEMANLDLAVTVFKLASFLSYREESLIHTATKNLPKFLMNQEVRATQVVSVVDALSPGLRPSSQDVVVSLIYTLINMLTADVDVEGANGVPNTPSIARSKMMPNDFTTAAAATAAARTASEDPAADERKIQIYRNVVTAVVGISVNYEEDDIKNLASTVLSQKLANVSRKLDHEVLIGTSKLAPYLNEREFRLLIRIYTTIETSAFKVDEPALLDTVSAARCNIARALKEGDPLYDVFLIDLLTSIVNKGDVQELEHHRPHTEISANANEIALLLDPLAELLPSAPSPPYETSEPEILRLFRNIWFNMVVHGFSKNSTLAQKHKHSLETIARSTPPLVSETSSNKIESELELNTVLRRGSSNSNVNHQKEIMSTVVSAIQHNFEFRSIHYPKLMFLAATIFLESLRASTGNCSKVLLYFGDPGFRSGDTSKYMGNIATDVTRAYILEAIKGDNGEFSIEKVAMQLKEVLVLCCHRVRAIQNGAFASADLLIKSLPSALCRQQSLFALLDLLTLLWTSVLDAETDEYEPRAVFSSPKSDIWLELSDSYDHRRETLEKFLNMSRKWVRELLDTMNYNVKSILTGYLASMGGYRHISHVTLGCTFALEMGGSISRGDGELAFIEKQAAYTDTSSGFLSQYVWRTEFKGDEQARLAVSTPEARIKLVEELEAIMLGGHKNYNFEEIRDLLFKASILLSEEPYSRTILRACIVIPFKVFTEKSLQLGIALWLWAINEMPQLEYDILAQVAEEFEHTIKRQQGIFSRKTDAVGPEYDKMEYAPSNKAEIDHYAAAMNKKFAPHKNLIRFLSYAFQAAAFQSKHVLRLFTRLATVAMDGLIKYASQSPLARSVRFELVRFGIDVLHVHSRFSPKSCNSLRNLIIKAALSWFRQPAHWPYGGNKLKLRFDVALFKEISLSFLRLEVTDNSYNQKHKVRAKKEILIQFLNDELAKMSAWLDPLQTGQNYRDSFSKNLIKGNVNYASVVEQALSIDPVLAVNLVQRLRESGLDGQFVSTLQSFIARDPIKVVSCPAALQYFISNRSENVRRYILFWAPVSPIESINLFLPAYGSDSLVLQYAMRSIESYEVDITFFYVPQIVQGLRYDKSGYVERYILEMAKLNQLFSHQISWNILANSYKDEDSQVPDDIKPIYDRVLEKMVASFNDEERSFYKREFDFFDEVTSISGKLKPYIKKTKAEKKAKIDEEIAKIKVDVGVYLPSNPDGEVVDIDRKSGRPLQSHAKAPYMATFKIRREVVSYDEEVEKVVGSDVKVVDSADENSEEESRHTKTVEGWQSAIFKVGDDCRQDVLALQIISVFRSIFKNSGLDLYVFPNRVTATAPGCGVIDVLPNSISRDMLGREAVNGLYEYFTTKFGGEDSIEFQRARNNFVKSHAAYSVISYLIQFKDRHNGNIMYDNEGHILHIDFGFCFDIVPGGVKFEAAPFKLTHEMVQVLGGGTHTQAYRWFEELCVKAFLSCRPHCERIVEMVKPMLDSGLPCFKGETTIKRLRARFVPEKNQRDAALHFRSLIRKSYESMYTKGYDEFQRLTNGIPY